MVFPIQKEKGKRSEGMEVVKNDVVSSNFLQTTSKLLMNM